MLLSVALCTYNGEQFVQQQLESLAVQTLRPDELVIFDDRSTDGTVEIVKQFSRQAPFPVLLTVNEVTQGSTGNFERAIASCRGDLIALSDQDDIWHPKKLEVTSRALLDRPECGYAFVDMALVDEQLRPLRNTMWKSMGFSSHDFPSDGAEQVHRLIRSTTVTGAAMIFRASLRPLILPISSHWVHDSWIAFLASATSQPGYPINQALIDYRQHPKQQIGGGTKGIISKLRRSRERASSRGMVELAAFCDLRDRLVATNERLPAALALVEGKVTHLQVRTSLLHLKLWRRPLPVLSEAAAGRYHAYSNGLHSMLKDLLF